MKIKIGHAVYFIEIGNWYSLVANLLIIVLCIYGIYWLVKRSKKSLQ